MKYLIYIYNQKENILTLAELRKSFSGDDLQLLKKGSRLSVIPV